MGRTPGGGLVDEGMQHDAESTEAELFASLIATLHPVLHVFSKFRAFQPGGQQT